MVRYSAGEKKKRHIIEVCKKLFYEQGYAKTTYKDICDAADIPSGLINYHFRGKREIAAVIHTEYERQNKIYIESICGDTYDKTTLMAIENYHMWDKIFKVPHIRQFLVDMGSERIADGSSWDVVAKYYEYVMEEHSIDMDDATFAFTVCAQIGKSLEIILLINSELEDFTYDQPADFGVKFFLRQLGFDDETCEQYSKAGKDIYETLPIDLRYYKDFAYDEKYVTKLK